MWTIVKFAYTGIAVKDMDQSIKFYTEALDMQLLDRHPIEETRGEVAALKSKDSPQLLELNWYPDSQYREGNELDHLAFEVDDVKTQIDRLTKMGTQVARPTEVRSKYVVGFVKDPNGVWLELFPART